MFYLNIRKCISVFDWRVDNYYRSILRKSYYWNFKYTKSVKRGIFYNFSFPLSTNSLISINNCAIVLHRNVLSTVDREIETPSSTLSLSLFITTAQSDYSLALSDRAQSAAQFFPNKSAAFHNTKFTCSPRCWPGNINNTRYMWNGWVPLIPRLEK